MTILTACSSVTPTERIAANPAVFRSLTPQQQSLVRNGEIAEGMSPQAVFLAWGYPENAPYHGEKGGKKYTKWVYSRLKPIYNPMPAMWYGSYWGTRGWYGGGSWWGNDITYIPENTAYVLFENGKVTSWEAKNKNPSED